MNGTIAKTTTTVDVAIPRDSAGHIELLLIKRKKDPGRGSWALPGGKLDEADSTLEYAAIREMKEETDIELEVRQLTLVGVYGDAGRDSRGRYISVAYVSPVMCDVRAIAGDDAAETGWFTHAEIAMLDLAFDHRRIIADVFGILGVRG